MMNGFILVYLLHSFKHGSLIPQLNVCITHFSKRLIASSTSTFVCTQREKVNLTDSRAVTYDSREGFQLNLSEVKNPYGTYVCEANGRASYWKMDLVPPKGTNSLRFCGEVH